MNIHIVCMLNNTCIYVLFLKCLAVGLVSEVDILSKQQTTQTFSSNILCDEVK